MLSFLFYPESHKKKRKDRLEVFEKSTLAHSGEQVGKLEKAKHYQYEGGYGVSPVERDPEWLVTLGMTKVAKFQREAGGKTQTVAC